MSVTITNLIASGTGGRYDVCTVSEAAAREMLCRWQEQHGNDLLDVEVVDQSGDVWSALAWLA